MKRVSATRSPYPSSSETDPGAGSQSLRVCNDYFRSCNGVGRVGLGCHGRHWRIAGCSLRCCTQFKACLSIRAVLPDRSIASDVGSRTLSRLLLLAIIRRPLQNRFRLAVPLVFGLRDRGGAVRQHVASEQTLAALEPLCIGILGPARPVRAGVALCSGVAHLRETRVRSRRSPHRVQA